MDNTPDTNDISPEYYLEALPFTLAKSHGEIDEDDDDNSGNMNFMEGTAHFVNKGTKNTKSYKNTNNRQMVPYNRNNAHPTNNFNTRAPIQCDSCKQWGHAVGTCMSPLFA